MGVAFRKNFDFNDIAKDLITEYQRRVEIAMSDLKTKIEMDTQAGVDIDGGPLKEYKSLKYVEYKKRRGRTGSVDMRLTGTMMKAMDYEVKRTSRGIEGRLFFRPTPEPESQGETSQDLARKNIKTRKFFGISNATWKKMLNKIKRG